MITDYDDIIEHSMGFDRQDDAIMGATIYAKIAFNCVLKVQISNI